MLPFLSKFLSPSSSNAFIFTSVLPSAKTLTQINNASMKRILIIDDHSIVRTGIKLIIKRNYPGAEIIEAHNEKTAIVKVNLQEFDMILMDLNMPESDPTSIIYYIKNKYPQTAIAILSMNEETVFAKRFFKLGIKGYINKSQSDTEIEKAINKILNGQTYISDYLKGSLAELALNGYSENPFESLSDREFQVMQELLRGKTITDISGILNINASTVSTYKAKVFEKLNIQHNNIVELMNVAKSFRVI